MGADPQTYDISHGVVALGGDLDVEDIQGTPDASAVVVDDASFTALTGDDAQEVLESVDVAVQALQDAPAGGIEGALACLTADATLTSDNAVHAVPWDDETYDDSAYHSTSVNPERITIPAGKGGAGTRFKLTAHVNVSATGFTFYIRDKLGNRGVGVPAAPVANKGVEMSITVNAPADGDWFDVAYEKAATNGTLNSALDLFPAKKVASYFAIEKLK